MVKLLNVQDKAMIIAMEYAAGGTLLELLDARVKFCVLNTYSFPKNFNVLYININKI